VLRNTLKIKIASNTHHSPLPSSLVQKHLPQRACLPCTGTGSLSFGQSNQSAQSKQSINQTIAMTYAEYRQRDALALADLVRRGEITPDALLDIAIARAEEANPAINAIVHRMYDEARAAAKNLDRAAPFAGVPFLVKDLGPEVKGAPKRTGSRAYEGYVSADDNEIVRKMRAAGLLILGKTNTPEFGLTPYTEPKRFGPTRNPWHLEHSPGGSSGGSAAAVAAGIVPMASANDGGGSIRIPASFCGLFGLKISRGRVSWAPQFGEMWSGAAVEGCVSRSVRDSAAYLDALCGPAPGDPYPFAVAERPFLEEVSTMPGRLRIGFSTKNTVDGPVEAVCVQAVEQAAALLRSEGHTVEEADLPYEAKDLTEAFITVVAAEVAADLRILEQFLGRRVRPSDVEPETFALGLLGQSFTGSDYAFAKRRWNEVSRRVGAFHERYDLLLTPTLPRPPFRIGALQSTAAERAATSVVNALRLRSAMKMTVDQIAQKIYAFLCWTPFANMTGQPSMSVPMLWADDQLPVGAMLTGRIGEDGLLFRVAGQMERAQPWAGRFA
jgi:amidase